MSRGLSFSRGAGAAQGVEAPDREPGDEAVGPTLPVGALPFWGRPSSLSSPTERYSHRSQHVSLPWFGECDKTGASGLAEGVPWDEAGHRLDSSLPWETLAVLRQKWLSSSNSPYSPSPNCPEGLEQQ